MDAGTQVGTKGTYRNNKGIPERINSSQPYEDKQGNIYTIKKPAAKTLPNFFLPASFSSINPLLSPHPGKFVGEDDHKKVDR